MCLGVGLMFSWVEGWVLVYMVWAMWVGLGVVVCMVDGVRGSFL